MHIFPVFIASSVYSVSWNLSRGYTAKPRVFKVNSRLCFFTSVPLSSLPFLSFFHSALRVDQFLFYLFLEMHSSLGLWNTAMIWFSAYFSSFPIFLMTSSVFLKSTIVVMSKPVIRPLLVSLTLAPLPWHVYADDSQIPLWPYLPSAAAFFILSCLVDSYTCTALMSRDSIKRITEEKLHPFFKNF